MDALPVGLWPSGDAGFDLGALAYDEGIPVGFHDGGALERCPGCIGCRASDEFDKFFEGGEGVGIWDCLWLGHIGVLLSERRFLVFVDFRSLGRGRRIRGLTGLVVDVGDDVSFFLRSAVVGVGVLLCC